MTPVCEWQGFIFINVDPNPQPSLRDYLGDLGRGLDGYPFETISATCRSWTTEVKANWKFKGASRKSSSGFSAPPLRGRQRRA